MITEDQINKDLSNNCLVCYVCKNKLIEDIEYYCLVKCIKDKNAQDQTSFFMGATSENKIMLINFCKDCWQNVAGEQYELPQGIY